MMDHCIPNSIYTLPLLMLFLQNFSFKKSLSYSVASILISRFFQEQTLSTRVQFFFMEPNDQIIAHLPSIHSLPTPFYAQLLVFFLNADLIISLLSSNTFRRIFFFPDRHSVPSMVLSLLPRMRLYPYLPLHCCCCC